ncbi:uncharacterized protein PRCAT00005550001 [Priceomyces carsonii]|uniref:uncharacterized protein n=1 Tax=Priceomyces carsonii TaxID=28549 RepID=UPI002EDB0491|nr:unnamed protein product [Priceomyces carsonii]
MVPVTAERKRSVPDISSSEPKRLHAQGSSKKLGKRKYKAKSVEPTSPSGVLQYEIKEMLKSHEISESEIFNDMRSVLNDGSMQEKYHRIVKNVTVLRLSSNGDGLAIIPHPIDDSGKQICIIPFGLPGDVVDIKVFKTHPLYVESDLLGITKESDLRDDKLINCKYFGKCSGCQFQNVDYDRQLILKRSTIMHAYEIFAPRLSSKEGSLPEISNTEPSPLEYGYRTKLTPHFNLPYKKPEEYPRPPLGFGAKGRPKWRKEAHGGDFSILDIEDCPIGTDIINKGMKQERDIFEKDYMKYKKGATILLREDSKVVDKKPDNNSENGSVVTYQNLDDSRILMKTCVTKSRQIVTEYVNGYTFTFSAGEFFQNNNSILPVVISYVKSKLDIDNSPDMIKNEPLYLVDAYCGSGLFSITCSEKVSSVIGVEVSADSVQFAQRNARENNIHNAKFIVGKAEKIFANIDSPPLRTSVILDPPRKGCDEVFLRQLAEYNPARIVYVSCNVHSQARDIDWFINCTENGSKYIVESIKGFDFFPQTHHVESVAVLALK